MSLEIPNTTATAQFVKWGGSLLANNGWIFAANGSLDVVILVGPNTGLQSESPGFTIPPGQSPLSQGSDEFIHGVLIRAGGGVVSTPAQQYSGALFEAKRASIGAGTPFTGFVSPTGSITPGPSMINGVTGSVDSTGTAILGTGYTSSRSGTGQYNVMFSPALASPPVVTLGPGLLTGGSVDFTILPSTTQFAIESFDDTGSRHDVGFQFIAIIPQ